MGILQENTLFMSKSVTTNLRNVVVVPFDVVLKRLSLVMVSHLPFISQQTWLAPNNAGDIKVVQLRVICFPMQESSVVIRTQSLPGSWATEGKKIA